MVTNVHPARVDTDHSLVLNGHVDQPARVNLIELAVQNQKGQRGRDDHRGGRLRERIKKWTSSV